MIDLEQLAQAREQWIMGSQGWEETVETAVDAVLEADQTWWCKTHDARQFAMNPEMCEHVEWMKRETDLYQGVPCRMVSVVVVLVETPSKS